MKQYQEVKKKHPDCLIMLRMGDFYEMFYEDAITAARELEITLTSRGQGEKKAPLAGIPFHALEPYLGKLIKKGYKVAIVEQLEDPKKAKGLVKRGLVRIVTPGTVIESSMLNERENNYIMSLTAFNDQFAVAFCDISTGEFFTKLLENSNQLMSEIFRLNPSECLIPESLKANSELITKIKATGCFLNSLEDYFFKTEISRNILLDHFKINSLESFGLEEKKLNLAASGALLKYLLDTQKNTLSHIQKISYQGNLNLMFLDSNTLRNLELIKNLRDGTTRGTLLSVIDRTVTAMGSRLLKNWIKEPLLNIEAIEQRLDTLEKLNQNVICREELISLLKQIQDLERLISRINYGNANPRDLLALKNSLQQIPEIKSKLKLLSSPLIQTVEEMSEVNSVTELINRAIKEDALISLREG